VLASATGPAILSRTSIGMHGLLTKTSTLCKAIVSVEADKTSGFGRINLKSIRMGQKIPFDLYLKSLSDCLTRANFLLGCSRNNTFREDRARKLEDMGIQWVYFAAGDQNLVLNYLAGNFREMLLEDRLDPLHKVVWVHDTLYIWMHIFFNDGKGARRAPHQAGPVPGGRHDRAGGRE
jgi:hypothetical protein